MDNRPIGVFDSGVGGLTVAGEIMKQLPEEEIVYFGDTARVPYGNKSKETVTKFSKQNVRFLLSKDVKAIVIACNTASANSLEEIRESFHVPVFGVVSPGAYEAVRVSKNKRIGIIATHSTIKSLAYEKAIKEKDSRIEIFSKACPLFVPLAEEGWGGEEITRLTAKKYLSKLLEEGIDTMVMGCTHYPLLRECISEVVGEGVCLVDPAYETALKVKAFFKENKMLRENKVKPQHSFYVSDKTEMFERICNEALNEKFAAEEIDIEKF